MAHTQRAPWEREPRPFSLELGETTCIRLPESTTRESRHGNKKLRLSVVVHGMAWHGALTHACLRLCRRPELFLVPPRALVFGFYRALGCRIRYRTSTSTAMTSRSYSRHDVTIVFAPRSWRRSSCPRPPAAKRLTASWQRSPRRGTRSV